MYFSLWLAAILAGLCALHRMPKKRSLLRDAAIGFIWGLCICLVFASIPALSGGIVYGFATVCTPAAVKTILHNALSGAVVSTFVGLFASRLFLR